MIRVNGVDYNASVAYPAEKLVATIATEAEFTTVFTNMSTASEVMIVNNNEVVASYACVFSGIEKLNGGYKVTFNRAPMTVAEVEALMRTVTYQGEQLAAQGTTIDRQGTAITTQGETIAQYGNTITSQGTTIGEHTTALNNNATELDDILSAITELGDLIAELLESNEGGE